MFLIYFQSNYLDIILEEKIQFYSSYSLSRRSSNFTKDKDISSISLHSNGNKSNVEIF